MSTEFLPEPERLARGDVRRMAAQLGVADVRFMVDLYYQFQDFRTQAANQQRAGLTGDEAVEAVHWTYDRMVGTEDAIRRLMDEYSDLQRPGRWAKSQVGIGPVLAAGCLATFDADKPTVGSWWRFAGLDPTQEWLGKERARELVASIAAEQGIREPEALARACAARLGRSAESILRQATPETGRLTRESLIAALAKRPYSARAKVLAWKIADSFVKQSGRDNAIYGKWYRQRKEYEQERDLAGGNAAAVAATLEAGRIRDKATLARYHTGHLPDGRLDLRARRWVAKLYLSHLHWVAYEDRHGSPPPLPYGIDILKHAHLIAPPGWPCD